MAMKKIYICGKVTGDLNYRDKFLAEENRLRSLGYDPVNPAALMPTAESWAIAMRVVVRAMLQCDGVSMLPDWHESRGAQIEVDLARALELDVRASYYWS